jgi:hypothetical protein
VSRDGYLVEGLNKLSVLSVYSLLVFKFFKSFSLSYTINNFLFASLKLLTSLKMVSEILLGILFSVIGRCSLVPTSHWLQGKFARTNLSQAALGMILQNHRRLSVSIFSVEIAAFGS